MKLDISFAGWLLALVSFLVGTILPVIYRRISFNGFVIKNITSNRLFIQIDEQIGTGNFYVLLIFKYLNSNKESVLVEDIQPVFSQIRGSSLKLINSFHENITDKDSIEILKNINNESGSKQLTQILSAIPMIVKTNDEKSFAHLFEVHSSLKDVGKIFDDYILKNGLEINAKVNGKLRKYEFHIDYV